LKEEFPSEVEKKPEKRVRKTVKERPTTNFDDVIINE
jgi:hypothetical protein